MSEPLWGIDLGGTKIEGVILPSIEEATPLLRLRIDTERQQGLRAYPGADQGIGIANAGAERVTANTYWVWNSRCAGSHFADNEKL